MLTPIAPIAVGGLLWRCQTYCVPPPLAVRLVETLQGSMVHMANISRTLLIYPAWAGSRVAIRIPERHFAWKALND